MANHAAITKHIVTAGDYNLVPAGQNLFDCPNCKAGKGGKIFFNVAPGQLVAYTISPTTLLPITVDSTTLESVTGDLYIGVGIDTDGDGAADDVRLLAGEKFNKCLINETSLSKPACGQPQILGAYIDCIKCWETYAVQFKYSDNRTRSFGSSRADQEEITVSVSPECGGCTDCPAEANRDEVICKLVDALNGEFDTSINGQLYPDRKGFYPERPYRAVRLHENWYTYCIDPIASACDCENCNVVDAIVSATINNEVVTFSGNLNPADNTQTYIAQLKNIAQQIECAFEEKFGHNSGFAYVTGGGPDKCCPYALHVVTCDDNFVLTGSEGTIATCDSINPFPTFTNKLTCVDCSGSPATTYTPDKGLAVIIEQPDLDCGCYIDKPLAWYGRTGELTFIKDLDKKSPIIKAAELLSPKFPENFGAWIQWLEYSQETGGRGRNYRDINAQQGWLGLPDSQSRANNAISFSNCKKSYCSWYIGHNEVRHPSLTKSVALNSLKSFIHIPSDDLNTIADWEEFYGILLGLNGNSCTVLSSGSCLPPTPTPTPTPTATPTPTPTATPTPTP